MIIFGVNLPLAEIFFILVMLFLVFLVMIILQLQKLQKMTEDEKKDLEELERIAQDEKKDLEDIKAFEQRESQDISKFEKDIMDLEEDTDTLYLKKLAPDLYKIQNYTLWALKKGMDPKQIKETLISKGWKDKKLVEMIVEDTLKYSGYYSGRKGDVQIPDIKIEEEKKVIEKPINIVKVVQPEAQKEEKKETTTKVLLLKEPKEEKPIAQKKSVKPKKLKLKPVKKEIKPVKLKKAVTAKLPEDSFGAIEKELTKLEKDLKSKEKKTEEKKTSPKKQDKKPEAKKAQVKKPETKKVATVPKKEQKASKSSSSKKAPDKKSGKKGKEDTVHIEAKKGTEVKVTYK